MGCWKRIAACGLIGAALAGCSSEADRQAKMNQDRAAMQLTQAQHECDDYKSQIDQMKNDLLTAQKQQKESDDTVAELKKQLTKAQMDCVDSTKKQQEDEKELAELRTQVDSLRHAAAPTTAP